MNDRLIEVHRHSKLNKDSRERSFPNADPDVTPKVDDYRYAAAGSSFRVNPGPFIVVVLAWCRRRLTNRSQYVNSFCFLGKAVKSWCEFQ